MMPKTESPFDDFLGLYDSLPKDSFLARRTAFRPLYEFFHRITLVVGVRLCRLFEDSLRISSLQTLWNQVSLCLKVVDPNLDRWNMLISNVWNVRNGIEHNLEYNPSANNFGSIRAAAPEFRDWIIEAGKRNLEQSKDFTLSQHFEGMLSVLLDRAQLVVEQYRASEGPLGELATETQMRINAVNAGRKLKKAVQEVSQEVVREVGLSDLNDLVAMSQAVSRLEAVEQYLLGKSVCPKCGGNIVQTQRSLGGGPEEQPSAIAYRVGCEKCEYELVSETINI